MAKTRESYQVQPNDLSGLNFALARIADRLDKLEGIRGTSKLESDTVEVGSTEQTRIKLASRFKTAPDEDLEDGEADFQVYDDGSSPVLRVRYRSGDDVLVGDVALL